MSISQSTSRGSNFHGILHYYTAHFWEATTAKRIKIDPYYQQQKCRPMTLVSRNIRRMRIFTRVPLGVDVKWQWRCRRRNFWRFGWLLLWKR